MSAGTYRSSGFRARVKPRGPGRRRLSDVQWDRVGRIALVLVLFAVMASYVNPVVNLFDNWRDSRAAEERLAELQAVNGKLEARVKELRTPAAAIREARKLGFVGAGERAYVFKDLE